KLYQTQPMAFFYPPRVALLFIALGKLLHIYLKLFKNIDKLKIKPYTDRVSLDLSQDWFNNTTPEIGHFNGK
ncbi:MAG: hypothetical protein PVH70_12880, partial [Desulfobacterales bacterium]